MKNIDKSKYRNQSLIFKIETEFFWNFKWRRKCENYYRCSIQSYANFQTQRVFILLISPRLGSWERRRRTRRKRARGTSLSRSVVWNEIRIGDKKTGLRRILPRFIDWILWHQLILIVLSQESYHQDQAQCQGGSGHRKSPRRASAKVIVNLFCDGFLNWWILFSPKIILQIHVLIHPVKTPGRGSLGDHYFLWLCSCDFKMIVKLF